MIYPNEVEAMESLDDCGVSRFSKALRPSNRLVPILSGFLDGSYNKRSKAFHTANLSQRCGFNTNEANVNGRRHRQTRRHPRPTSLLRRRTDAAGLGAHWFSDDG